jgi:catalase (peroxidase I)
MSPIYPDRTSCEFARDFAAAWVKVMDLDRFDVSAS